MTVQALLDQAAVLRREARQVWFLHSGDSPRHAALLGAALALERAAAATASAHNQAMYSRRSA